MIPRKSIDQVGPRQMRKRLMQAFNRENNRESINLVENISTLTRDDGVRYDTILENDVYDYSQQNDQEDELEHKCVFEVEDESELDQPEEREVNFDEQVYENAPITVSNSMFLILMIFLRHNVSLECIADIIAVINLHCMKSRLVKNSLYKFRKYFSLDHSEFIKHYYCHFCGRVQLESDSICPSCPPKKNPYFIQLPFLEHLREMYKRDGFYSKLQDCHNKRINNNPDCISDVYDGVLYRKYVQKGFLCNPDNISFTWYTDGIPVFKSSKISAWPIYLTLNELPIKERKKRENTLLLGLWYGDKKPNMNYFFHVFYDDLKKLVNGIEVYIPCRRINITVKGILLLGTCDLPARSDCLNFVQYNGYYGCSYCFCPGMNFTLETGGNVHVYPYTNNIEKRTLQNCRSFADNASRDAPIMGIKGPTALSLIMPDYVMGMAIDRMHCVEGGVVKKLLSLFFNTEFKNKPFSLYAVINVIDARLKSIKPPKFVHRMPRSVTELLHWKASELKLWFFHYSLPVLYGILAPQYFEHYVLLVAGISILNSNTISLYKLDVARDFLHKYVKCFEYLYGEMYCSINVHQLLHLPDCVQNLGPLWVYSCFEYEDINGQLLKLIHGTRHIDSQVSKSQEFYIKKEKIIECMKNKEVKEFCLKRKKQVKIIKKIFEHTYSVGVYKVFKEFPSKVEVALRTSNITVENISLKYYLRVLKNDQLFIAEMYRNNMQTYSSAISYNLNNKYNIGFLHYFLKINNEHFAIVEESNIEDCFIGKGHKYKSLNYSFIKKCTRKKSFIAIPVKSLLYVCIYINIDGNIYVGLPINKYELE